MKTKLGSVQKWFNRWILFMGIMGVLSFLFASILNDNGINSHEFIWGVFTADLRLFVLLAFAISSTVIIMRVPSIKKEFQQTCYYMLLGITGATIIIILLGYRGYNSSK